MIDKTVKRKLFDALCVFHKEKNFVLSVMSIVQHDEDRQTIIDFINQKKKPTEEEVLLMSVDLNQKRYPERYID
ncbi:MAG: hypothetical protein J6K70_00320 [Selenomonadales bacterium]|nr:hypothetical protein [Selenomonadales bacterium]